MEPAAERIADTSARAPAIAPEGVVAVLGRSPVAGDGREPDERARLPTMLTCASMAQAAAGDRSARCYNEPLTENPRPRALKAGAS